MLDDFLANKPLYYKKIDYTRMPRAWECISQHFKLPKIVHIIGTNGKGTTGRFLAHYLKECGDCIGHFTSPHILKFNERIWIDGSDISDEQLEVNHQKLLKILPEEFQESLSYFEYTTLLAMVSFEGCDYIVLEAGLGGVGDATSVFGSDLTLVTPISIDHQQFLGDTIDEIATNKLKAVNKFAIHGNQSLNRVYKVSKKLASENGLEFFRYSHFFTHEEKIEATKFIKKLNMADFFVDNLLLAMAGAKFIGCEVDFSKLGNIEIKGRCQKIAENVTIDVGHNAAAATALLSHFKNKEIVLVYNSFADKDYKEILNILKPAIKRVELLPIVNERVEEKEVLVQTIKSLDLSVSEFEKINDNDDYLVFGSFLVVEEFLNLWGNKKVI